MNSVERKIITVSDLTKVYRAETVETHAVKGISLVVNEGEFLAIEGASGSGKSTFLSLLGSLEAPTSGSYRFFDSSIFDMKRRELSRFRAENIGFVFQSFNLLEHYNVLDNLLVAQRCANSSSKRSMCKRARDMLSSVGMTHREKHYPNQLSGGQQQRVAIARALINRPKLILADEPTGNLDTRNSESVMNLLKEQNDKGATVCMVTHDVEVSQWASRVVTMKDGQFLVDAP